MSIKTFFSGLFGRKSEKTFDVLRITLGAIFFWAFLDKVFGLGFDTEPAHAWLNGVSPTQGYLLHATRGVFADYYKLLAGNVLVDWLFMVGLAGIGTSLLLGIGTRVAGYSGLLMMALMYLAQFPPEHHPFLDEHVIYGIILGHYAVCGAGEHWSIKKWWSKQPFVKKYPFVL